MGVQKLTVTLILFLLWCGSVRAQDTTTFVGSTGSTNVSNSAVNYFALTGIDGVSTAFNGSGTDSFPGIGTVEYTFTNFWCFLGAAPGTGKSYTIKPITSTGGAVNNTITISNSATSGSDTSHTTNMHGINGTWAMSVTPAGTPTATTVSCYLEATIN